MSIPALFKESVSILLLGLQLIARLLVKPVEISRVIARKILLPSLNRIVRFINNQTMRKSQGGRREQEGKHLNLPRQARQRN